MLTIRMQRTGRKGHAQFRIVVQDTRQAPASGKFVAMLGHYNPHTKDTTLLKDKTEFYLGHGAQPSTRVARLLVQQGVALPKWVKLSDERKRSIRKPEKLRKNASQTSLTKSEDKSTEKEAVQSQEPVEPPKPEDAPPVQATNDEADKSQPEATEADEKAAK